MDQLIKLQITQDDVNYILNLLQREPYMQVAPLIQKLVEQGEPQCEVKQNDANSSGN